MPDTYDDEDRGLPAVLVGLILITLTVLALVPVVRWVHAEVQTIRYEDGSTHVEYVPPVNPVMDCAPVMDHDEPGVAIRICREVEDDGTVDALPAMRCEPMDAHGYFVCRSV